MTSYDVTQNFMTLHGVIKIGPFESAILDFSIYHTSEANCWLEKCQIQIVMETQQTVLLFSR